MLRGPLASDADALRQTVRLGAGASAVVNVPLRATGVGAARSGRPADRPEIRRDADARARRRAGNRPAGRSAASMNCSPAKASSLSSGPARRIHSGNRRGVGDRGAARRRRCRGPVARARQLSLGLFGTDGQPRHAPALSEQAVEIRTSRARRRRRPRKIDAAIAVLLSRQDFSGAFGLWSADSADDVWLDAFVTDFLTRARESKYAVPQKAMDQALDRLRNYVVNASEVNAGNSSALAYAVYVLARNGRPVVGDLRYLADARLDAFDTPSGARPTRRRAVAARRPRPRRKNFRRGVAGFAEGQSVGTPFRAPISARFCATARAC